MWKNELAKDSSPQGEKPLYELLQMQKPHIGKEGLGYIAKKNKKNDKDIHIGYPTVKVPGALDD